MRFAFVTAILLTSGTASAHIVMSSPAPRTESNKAAPCGGATTRANVVTFAPGATMTVEWDETVDHPGHYRIAFDNDGTDFQNPVTPDDNFPETMVEPIADKSGGHYAQQITLPMEPCENCTIQLMQIMTTTVPYNSFYYQCADIRIAEGGVDPVDPPPGGDGDDGGCSTGSGGGLAMLGVVLAFARRRRIR